MKRVYLEAANRSQDLVTTKWILRGCGYMVKSTWHEESSLGSSGSQGHWSWARLEEMKACDTLVVVREPDTELPPELAVLVGFAAARNLRVIWVGLPVDLLGHFTTLHLFATVDDLRKELLYGDARWHASRSGDLSAARTAPC